MLALPAKSSGIQRGDNICRRLAETSQKPLGRTLASRARFLSGARPVRFRRYAMGPLASRPNEGWLYLAVILDLFTRQMVGWAMLVHHREYPVSRYRAA